MKYTQQQYEASARKHGITPGPWRTSATVSGCGVSVRVVTDYNGGQPIASVGTHDTNLSDRTSAHHENSNEIRENAKRAASLPDLLIALDEKDAEIERLTTAAQNACDALHQWRAAENTNDAVELGNARTSRDKAYDELRAALNGGGA